CKISANSSRTIAVPRPNAAAAPARHVSENGGAASPAMPPAAMSTTPKTMWCTCTVPATRSPGHHRTPARISRTETRMAANPATKATKKQNSGSRPVCTTCAWNQPDTNIPPQCRSTLSGGSPRVADADRPRHPSQSASRNENWPSQQTDEGADRQVGAEQQADRGRELHDVAAQPRLRPPERRCRALGRDLQQQPRNGD